MEFKKESEDAGQAMTAAAKGLQINQQQYVTRNYRCSQMYGMNGLFAGGRFAPNTIGGMGAAALAGLNTGSPMAECPLGLISLICA